MKNFHNHDIYFVVQLKDANIFPFFTCNFQHALMKQIDSLGSGKKSIATDVFSLRQQSWRSCWVRTL